MFKTIIILVLLLVTLALAVRFERACYRLFDLFAGMKKGGDGNYKTLPLTGVIHKYSGSLREIVRNGTSQLDQHIA